jgi:mRNA-degrading endonuclease RelE of RelBE toxin-antitoxin system/PHD/YefM family antitoxin component YafN of YafNO toxin-antitoxin module
MVAVVYYVAYTS